MIFSSYIFIFLFLPVVTSLYFLMSRLKSDKVQKILLVISSLIFYGYFNYYYLIIILTSIAINYFIAHQIQKNSTNVFFSKGLFLLMGVLFNILLLGYFKYYDFFISNINILFNASFNLRYILLPLGISFFTFQQLSFLISVYKKEDKVADLLTYLLFVTFFPQLIAGPIVLYSEMIPQFLDKNKRLFNYENFTRGLYLFLIGLFKKIVIADTVAIFVNNGYSGNDFSFLSAWILAISFSIQIYFDFSGYADMAIGIGKIFNIDIPLNFSSPYKSKSITEFWKRWHITLGRALKTYIYIPLGGNRKGTFRTYFNLLIVFFVSGLWHGASWMFIIWGMLHGIFMIFEKIFERYICIIPSFIRICFTFIGITILWVFFRANSLSQALSILNGMISIIDIDISKIAYLAQDGIIGFPLPIAIIYISIFIVFPLFLIFFSKNSIEKFESFKFNYSNLIFLILITVISLVHLSRLSPFIYFNF